MKKEIEFIKGPKKGQKVMKSKYVADLFIKKGIAKKVFKKELKQEIETKELKTRSRTKKNDF